MIIRAIVHRAEEGGFWAEAPALPGCVTQGETMVELRDNLREAVEAWLESGPIETAMGQNEEILEIVV